MSDALERLKQRNRPTVPQRDASLNSNTSASASPDVLVSRYQDSQISTKQSTMRLEQGLSDRLQDLCRENGISREVLIEALFENFEANPVVQAEVLTTAKEKHAQRQQVANLKRAQSMMQRFGD